MKNKTLNLNSEAGTVTILVLMLCTSMMVCVATMLSVILIRMQIETNYGVHQVVYEAVKSISLANVRILKNKELPVNRKTLVGNVSVGTAVSGTNVITVQVTGTYLSAKDTIRFAYDTIQNKVTDWKENVPFQ